MAFSEDLFADRREVVDGLNASALARFDSERDGQIERSMVEAEADYIDSLPDDVDDIFDEDGDDE